MISFAFAIIYPCYIKSNKYLQLYRIGSFMNTVCKKTIIVKIY